MKRQLLLFAIFLASPAQRRGDSGGNWSGYEQISQCCPSLFLGWGLSWQLPERGTAKARKNDKRKQAAQDDFDPMRKICTFCKRVLFLGAIPADRSKAEARTVLHLPVAHSMLIAIYHMLRNNVPFRDLGSDYYDSFNRDRKIHGYLKRLKALGWEPDALPGSA